jgi:uncharacterized protein YbjT (DUF2867 family)
MMGEQKPILVLGGTGHYGRHIVRSLLKKEEPVRVLSRNTGRARDTLGQEVEIVEGDITSSEAVGRVLDGVRAVVISVSAFSPQLIRRLEAIERDAVLMVLAEMKRREIPRVVYISVYAIQEDLAKELGLKSAPIKLAVENTLAQSDLNWTVLGAPPSTEIFFAMIRGNRMIVPGGGPPALPTISPVDVGEIAAQAALRDDLGGKRFRLAGPEALSFPEAAERISQAAGRPIRFQAIPSILPRIASVVLQPLTPFSDRLFFACRMLRYVRLLNQFPPEFAAAAAAAHRLLQETFDYAPKTLEVEAVARAADAITLP